MDDSKLQIPEADELRVFTAEQVRVRLGGISESYYYEIRSKGLLRFSRLLPGGKACHTPQQLRDYIEYLNGAGEVRVAVDELAARRAVGVAARHQRTA